MKLSTRLSEAAQIERLRRLLLSYQTNLDVEIQQRAAEYSNLFAYDQIRRGVLEKMPPPEIREEQRVLGEASKRPQRALSKKKVSQKTEQDLLLGLIDDPNIPATGSSPVNGSQNTDLLAMLGGSTSVSSPPQTGSPLAAQPQSNVTSILDLFNSSAPATGTPGPSNAAAAPSVDLFGGMDSLGSPPPQRSMASPPPAQPQGHEAYNKNGLHISFQTRRDASAVQILARFRNTGSLAQLSGVSLQAAVPKSQRLQLQAISSSELAPGGTATQQMRVQSVNGPPPSRVRLRLKIGYSTGGGPPTAEQVDWSEPV